MSKFKHSSEKSAFKTIMILNYLIFSSIFKGQPSGSIHALSAVTITGETIRFDSFKGKKILIVNTASQCGFTSQYKQLQELYAQNKDKGLVIIAFPSNDFAGQEPASNQDIQRFCEQNYAVSFLMMEKISVRGSNTHPIYTWLTSKNENGVMNSKVKWNFQKYLVDEQGYLIDVVSPLRKPKCRKIRKWLNK